MRLALPAASKSPKGSLEKGAEFWVGFFQSRAKTVYLYGEREVGKTTPKDAPSPSPEPHLIIFRPALYYGVLSAQAKGLFGDAEYRRTLPPFIFRHMNPMN